PASGRPVVQELAGFNGTGLDTLRAQEVLQRNGRIQRGTYADDHDSFGRAKQGGGFLQVHPARAALLVEYAGQRGWLAANVQGQARRSVLRHGARECSLW